MHDHDSTFFEAYKKLEKACSKLYNRPHGVSLYIDDMENTPSSISDRIPSWKDDYYQLKHCRYIRNQLAHEDVSSSNPMSTSEDLSFVQNFCERISNQTDSLTIAGTRSAPADDGECEDGSEVEEEPIFFQTPSTPPPSTYTPSYTNAPRRKPGLLSRFFDNSTAVAIGCGCGVPLFLIIILAILGFLVQKNGW